MGGGRAGGGRGGGTAGTGGGGGGSLDAGADLDAGVPDAGSPDAGPATAAWGHPCAASTACAAPATETGFCALGYGRPRCLHSCSGAEYSPCEGTGGLCVRGVCVPKCSASSGCDGGASCAVLGIDSSGVRVGVCRPDCSVGPDACTAAGRVCDPVRRECVGSTCEPACLAGASCDAGVCVPGAPKALYAACTASDTTANGCASNLCWAAPGGSAGFCTQACNTSGPSQCGSGVCFTDAARTLDAGVTSGAVTGRPIGQFIVVGARSLGACAKACDTSGDCPAGAYCAEWSGQRVCLFGSLPPATVPAAGNGVPGQLCRSGAQCATGTCRLFPGFADGICEKATAAGCPAGTVSVGGDTCARTCDPAMALQCNGSHVCDGVFTTPSICQPGTLCRTSSDCLSGFECSAASGECRASPLPGAGAVGASCTSAATCSGNVCLTAGNGYPLGYCTSSCTLLPEFADTCPSGALCTGLGVFNVGSLGVCSDLCDVPPATARFGACRAGYTCSALPANPAVGRCAP